MNQQKLIVSGSIAYDYILGFSGDLNENLHSDPSLNEFQLPVMPETKELRYGGTSGNIGYNLSLLNQPTSLLTSVGKDYQELGYEKRIKDNQYLEFIGDFHENLYTANCYMVNDKWLNQIIIFHGGAMSESSKIKLKDRGLNKDNVKIMSISPDNFNAMYNWAIECSSLEIPFVFDPGQVTPAFSSEMLKEIIPKANILIGNQYEIKMIQEKLGIDLEGLKNLQKNIIITIGDKGSKLYFNGEELLVKCSKAHEVKDPTGAGDGYRSGLLFGIMHNSSLIDACKIGSVVGSFVVETIGPQTQEFNLNDMKIRFESEFDEKWKW